MAAAPTKRLLAEMKRLQNKGFEVELVDDDVTRWVVRVPGPEGTPYEGGVFRARFDFPTNYPFSPPTLTMLTKIFHPNVTLEGVTCVPALKSENWQPAHTCHTAVLGLIQVLTEPLFEDALVPELVTRWDRDPKKYTADAKRWTAKYASPTD